MATPRPFVAVDWGTTNRRLFEVGAGGTYFREEIDECGVGVMDREALSAEIQHLKTRFPEHPIILAGMIGSTIGWHETAYLPCPAGIEDLLKGAMTFGDEQCLLLPGLRSAKDATADVMRGEEVQVIGAALADLIPANCCVCHPGTHAKWVRVKGAAIQGFRTVMTGELFAALRKASILSSLFEWPVSAGPAFQQGFEAGIETHCIGAELFSIRARVLLGELDAENAASFGSGLLIGSDIRFGLNMASPLEPVVVMGDPHLTSLYAFGLKLLGRACYEVDGSKAFLAGARAIAQAWPARRTQPCPA